MREYTLIAAAFLILPLKVCLTFGNGNAASSLAENQGSG
jgi:hypothetical protein